MTFKSWLEVKSKDPQGSLLFLASVTTTSTSTLTKQVLVKLVANRQYGTDAHRKVARAGYAPSLIGIARVEGAPTAYIIEYLPPDKGWKTLYEYAEDHQLEDILSSINEPLGPLLEMMKQESIVHGDLRPNNIMVNTSTPGKLEIKIVDSNWAGTSGEVRYPKRRNEGIPWPAGPGEQIISGYDYTLLMACLKKQKQKSQ